MDDGVAPLLDSKYGRAEREEHHGGHEGIRPQRNFPGRGGGAGNDHQEDDLGQHLYARRDSREKTAFVDRGDIREEGGIGIDGRVEEEREQEDRDSESDEGMDVEPCQQEEERRERDPDEHEGPAAADRGPDAVGDSPDSRLDEHPLDAPRAREESGEQIGRTEALEDRRQDEVVEREEGARADRGHRIERGRLLVERFHGSVVYPTWQAGW